MPAFDALVVLSALDALVVLSALDALVVLPAASALDALIPLLAFVVLLALVVPLSALPVGGGFAVGCLYCFQYGVRFFVELGSPVSFVAFDASFAVGPPQKDEST